MLNTRGVGGARGKEPPAEISEIYRTILDILAEHHDRDSVSIQDLVNALSGARERLVDDDNMSAEAGAAPATHTLSLHPLMNPG